MEHYTATVGDKRIPLDGSSLSELDISGPFHGIYHILHRGTGYRCRLIELDRYAKRLTIEINRRRITVQLADQYDQLVDRMGLAVTTDAASNEVNAPMPGLILDILVEAGQEVEAGTPLLILEAMKMENVLKADGAGTVRTVHVSKGAAVDKRQLLIEME